MKLTVTVKLLPTPAQDVALRSTLVQANAAANQISSTAWDTATFGQYALHKMVYHPVKKATGLTAQMVVRLIAKVADAYKLDRKRKRTFRPLGAIAYDDRILRWQTACVSIWTLKGRCSIPFVCDEPTRAMLGSRQGESDLLLRDGMWFLYAIVNVEEPPLGEPTGWLGIDMGVVNIATASDGNIYSGAQTNGLRRRHRRLRAKLQSKGTRAAKRLLRKRRRKEQRFATHTNHVISKAVVASAKAQGFGIAVEDLTGIRKRITARRAQRATLSSWAFYQLRQFVTYKAALAGVSVCAVSPRNTSRTCPECGHVAKANRRSQSQFLCISCGFSGLADLVAAGNIARRAVCRPARLGDGSPASYPGPSAESPAL